jgi:hypothetical protein
MTNPWRRYWDKVRARRREWEPVLEAELRKWSALSLAQVMAKLPESECYEVQFELKRYQVEVELLEDTDKYIRISVAVDDGNLPASFRPVFSSFKVNKDGSNSPPRQGRPQK